MPKICPKCGAIATDTDTFCHLDGTPLAEHPVTPHQEAAAQRSQQMAAPQDREAYVGQTLLGQFQISEISGSGSMGTVYKATQLEIEREVAIKILHPELANQPEAVLRFHREAKVISTLSHPNIVHIYLFGHLPDGNLYIVQEFIKGRSLADDMTQGTIGMRRTLHIADQILSAIGEAHANGVIHRDLKPENIMLTSVGNDTDFVKILDFGVAKRITTQTFATRDGLIFGSPRYISPEAAQGDKIDQRSDLYSLGVVLYQMLSGEPPFESRKPVQVLMDHINQSPPALRSKPAAIDVSPAIEAIVMKLLGKKPEHRYPTAQAVRDALIDATRGMQGQPVGSMLPPQGAPAVAPAQVQVASSSPAMSATAQPPPSQPGPGPIHPRVPTAQAEVGFDNRPVAARSDPGYGEPVSESELDGEQDVLSTEQMYSMQHRKKTMVRVVVALLILVVLPLLAVGLWFGYRAASTHLFTYDEVAETEDIAEQEKQPEETETTPAPPGVSAKISMDTDSPRVGDDVKLSCNLTGIGGGGAPKGWFVIQDVAGGEVRIVAKQVQSTGDGTEGRVYNAKHAFTFGGSFKVYFLTGDEEVKPALTVEVAEEGAPSSSSGKKKKKKKSSTSASTWVGDFGTTDPQPPTKITAPDPPDPKDDKPAPIKIIKIAPKAEDPKPPPKKSTWY